MKKSENSVIVVSGLVPRGDDLNEKVESVNIILQRMCNQRNLGFIDNSNINPGRHLNMSKLHLNVTGTNELQKNLQSIINC